MSKWTAEDIPNLRGCVALVTGANSGLGLETTRALAARGALVVMACRNLERAREAQVLIEAAVPDASLKLAHLDLASLASVRAFAVAFQETYGRLDMLFNNAGIMAIPRRETQDGFEMQFGTNYLAHFALTGLLLPILLATPRSRVITTTSSARMFGKLRFDDLNRTRSYGRWEAYGQSKTADLLFAFELQRRLAAESAQTISVAAHPGYAHTNLQSTSASASDAALESTFYTMFGPRIAQTARMGALPQLYAATSSAIHGGELVGPGGFGGMRGYPRVETKAQKEYNKAAAAHLWNMSTQLTSVDYLAG